MLHLAQLAWIDERANLCFLGPPGTGKTHFATALAIKACQQGYVLFATAQEWISRLEQAQDRNQLEQELRRLERYHLLIVDEVGCLPSRAATSAARKPTAGNPSRHEVVHFSAPLDTCPTGMIVAPSVLPIPIPTRQ